MKEKILFEMWELSIIKIPSFIDGTKPNHRMIWKEMEHINRNLKGLLVTNVLTEAQLRRIQLNILASIQFLDALLEDTPLELFIMTYYEVLFDVITEVAVEEEEFEVCQNIKNYREEYGIY